MLKITVNHILDLYKVLFFSIINIIRVKTVTHAILNSPFGLGFKLFLSQMEIVPRQGSNLLRNVSSEANVNNVNLNFPRKTRFN